MAQVNAELGLLATTNISLNQANVRALAGVPAGTISMNDLRGKTNAWLATISSPQQQLNLYTWAVGQGYPGTQPAQITVAPGVYIWSDDVATSALTIPIGFGAETLTLINQGYIMGRGGNGAGNTDLAPQPPASPGGPAISIATPMTIDNTSPTAYVGGGGGGGGFQYASTLNGNVGGGGGGAGGGNGGNSYGPSVPPVPGGSIGQVGATSTYRIPQPLGYSNFQVGGGGGRIFPGVGGVPVVADSILAGGDRPSPLVISRIGGGGGAGGGGGGLLFTASGRGVAGQNTFGGGGGGWGASGGNGGRALAVVINDPNDAASGGSSNQVGQSATSPGSPAVTFVGGGSGGNAVTLNGNSVTWVSGNTTRIWGSVS